MDNIYQEYSNVYEAMYKKFIHYDEEFEMYHALIKNDKYKSVLELGCGTGQLFPYFRKSGFEYAGVDLSEGMLNIATKVNGPYHFELGDMTTYRFNKQVGAVILVSRTVSYLLTNNQMMSMLISSWHNLNDGGVIAFDVIDASTFIPSIHPRKLVHHEAMDNDVHYERDSEWTVDDTQSWCFHWLAQYYEMRQDQKVPLFSDDTTLRCYTKEDIEIMFKLTGFQLEECIEKESYAFPTLVIKGRKVSKIFEADALLAGLK